MTQERGTWIPMPPQEISRTMTGILSGGVAGFRPEGGDLLFSTPGLADMAGYAPEDPELSDPTWFHRSILPEDRGALEDTAARQMRERGRIEVTYRLNRKDGTQIWVKQYAGMAEDERWGRYLFSLILDDTKTSQIRQQAAQAAGQVERIVKAIPGGVARVVLDEEYHIQFASDSFYNMTGYSREEFHAAPILGRGRALLLPEDEPQLRRTVRGAQEKKVPAAVAAAEYRVRRKDGSVLWITSYGARAERVGEQWAVDSVFVDTTSLHRLERERHMDAERCRIITERCQDIVFDWDLETDLVVHSALTEEKVGYRLPQQDMASLLAAGVYHPDDLPVLRSLADRLRAGLERAEAEYRLLRADGTSVWFRFRGATIFGSGGRPIRVVGVLNDIDRYMRENATLEQKARTDLLTGLLNRVSMEEEVRAVLTRAEPTGCHAFCLVDLDDFKEVNDSAGHDVGDAVLATMGRRIRAQFREEDTVGRMGGDEFAVFLSDLPSVEVVKERAQRLSGIFQDSFVTGAGERTVTGSIGIALCPDHGRTFEELYRKADRALYAAKWSGRNRWAMYGDTV